MLSQGLKLAVGLFHRVYLNRYRAIVPDEQGEFGRWAPVIAAARLDEKIEPDHEARIEAVRQALQS